MYTLNDIPPFLLIQTLLLPEAFTSAFYCFEICEKIAWQFKILAILYFYRFIIIFNVTLQESAPCYWIEQSWKILSENARPLYPISILFHLCCIWKYIAKVLYKERAFDHLHLLLAYYFFRDILQIESVALLYFEGIWR